MATVQGAVDVGGLVARIQEEIHEALVEAVEHTIKIGESHAKRLAPVRKVSEITRRRGKPRALSRAEVASLPASIRRGAEQIMRQGGNYYTSGRRSEQSISAPEVVTPKEGEVIPAHQRAAFARGQRYFLRDPDQASFLTGRGQRELRESGRRSAPVFRATGLYGGVRSVQRLGVTSAIYTAGGESTLGGRLKGEIRAELESRSRQGKVVGRVLSPTPYARYVEFPTSRTEAQPYMRPALKAMKRPFIAAVYRELKRRGFRPEPI